MTDRKAKIQARLEKFQAGNYSVSGTLYSEFGGDPSDLTAFWNCAPTDMGWLLEELERAEAELAKPTQIKTRIVERQPWTFGDD